MAADEQLTLLTGGQLYGGWKGVRVTRSMEHCAAGFDLRLSQLWPGQDQRKVIRSDEACEVRLGDRTVITGYVDAVEASVEKDAHEVRVIGRDKTADLVDCSAVRKPGQWRGQKIERIAQDLCKPFDIKVRADVDTGKPLTSFALQEGETVFEAIDRAARIRALLLMPDGRGGLLITRAGVNRAPTALLLGENVLSARAKRDMRDRFSEYIAKGQAPGSDYFSGKQVAEIRATASDAGVNRYRPTLFTNDAPDLAVTLKDRVRWEANVRAARSTEVECLVQGWSHQNGLWEPNTLVQVAIEPLQLLGAELLISAVEYSLDEDGTTATLTMTRADAFTVLPIKNKAEAGKFWDLPKPAAAGAK